MSLSRQEMLAEMGLSPRWVLRDGEALPVARRPAGGTAKAGANVAHSAVNEVMDEEAILTRPIDDSQAGGAVSPADVADMGWDELRRSILGCRACPLCEQRKQAVPGVGDERAGWMFIGEGPGAEEDARGEPFVGQAGRLLDAMLTAIDLRRGEGVYIANAVKCRPPNNRTPGADELAACRPYLARQIALIRPRLIVLLGRVAVQSLLGEDASLASLRGKALRYRENGLDIPVLVTYHPAYLLRNLPDKAKAWEDLCRARELMRAEMAS